MKIVVDEKGWTLVTEASDAAVKRGSGVYPKTANAESDADLAQARTEPCPPSDEALDQGGLRLPTAPRVPADLAVSDEGSKVA